MRSPTGEELIVRADANTEIGTGHLMRCLALAQAWKDSGGQVIFVTACSSEALLQRLHTEGFDVHLLDQAYPDAADWQSTEAVLRDHAQAWVVLDGYHFDEAYQQRVKESGHNLLVVDDMAHLKHYYADIVLNQNLHAEQLTYSCEPNTTLLLGTHHVLLRREFLTWKDWRREIPEVARHVLVTLGGSDPENYTLMVLRALQQLELPGVEATVIVGASNHYADALETFAGQSGMPMRVVHDAPNMPELMASAHVAISAAGSTVWELMFMGLPSLLVAVADNQAISVRALREHPEAIAVSHSSDQASLASSLYCILKDRRMKEQMSNNSRAFVDGSGAGRIVAALIGRTHVLSAQNCTEAC